jgi:hypothetical protein
MRHVPCLALLLCLSTPAAFADEVDFSHDVVAILKAHCAECHTGEKSEGGFSFNTQRQLQQSGYVQAGKPDESRLIELVESLDSEDQMPPKDRKRLSNEAVQILKKWIATGVAWESGFRFGRSGYEPPLLPREVQLPAPTAPNQNPIDQILGAYFQTKEIDVPKGVNDPLFLRRVSMDLIGLPPTLEQQTTFLDDANTDRRTRLVDELLARNHDYAEHWITFWNDLLRNDYAGTGYIDGGRRQITQWLYTALVTNKPYDQFVRELIAPTAESDGFISGIKWRGNVNASQVREIQFAQNVSQVFLGINMKCASCHDSFIDRWTLDEAYGMAAIYSTRELQIHRCDKPVGRTATAAWIFPEIGDVDANAEQPERLRQLSVVMTSPQNGRFARTIVNRIWHRMMGHGIVHPVDAMHTEPWNADLLDYLANYLVEQRYDLKAVMRLIATSQAYQSQSSAAQDSASSAEFVFHGPVARHLTAEQFIDSVWSIGQSAPQRMDAALPALTYFGKELPEIDLGGQWIWSYADVVKSPPGEQVAFRKTLTFGAKPQQAHMVITCDNEYTAYVNEKRVAADTDWGTIEVINLTAHLRQGVNEILIVGRNAGSTPNPAGLYAEMYIVDDENKKIRLASDHSWQASDQVPSPKKLDSVKWTPAVAVIPQSFLPPSAEVQIKAELSALVNGVGRAVRSSLLKSNMLTRSLGRPNREQIVTTRPASLSTLQAIDLANGEMLDAMLATTATQLHASIDDPADFLNRLFKQTICREPSEQERGLAMEILTAEPTVESVQDVIWLLVMHLEFQFVQ